MCVEVKIIMKTRIVGSVAVLAVTLAVVGMNIPQENENESVQVDLINTTEATVQLLNDIEVTQIEVDDTKEQEIAIVAQATGEEAVIQDSTVPLVASVVEANKRKTSLTDEEILLLQRIVSAEARGESFEAQYDVACVVLNRMESESFPDTLKGVVMQAGQFSCVPSGAYLHAPITESVALAVASAIDDNTLAADVLWFRSGHYHYYRTKAFQVGALFFST